MSAETAMVLAAIAWVIEFTVLDDAISNTGAILSCSIIIEMRLESIAGRRYKF